MLVVLVVAFFMAVGILLTDWGQELLFFGPSYKSELEVKTVISKANKTGLDRDKNRPVLKVRNKGNKASWGKILVVVGNNWHVLSVPHLSPNSIEPLK